MNYEARHLVKQVDYGVSFCPGDFTDEGNSQLFVETFCSIAKFCGSTDWLVWDGTTWRENQPAAERLAKALTDEMLKEADNAVYDAYSKLAEAKVNAKGKDDTEEIQTAKRAVKDAELFKRHALSSRAKKRIFDMLRLAQPVLTIRPETLDANPHYLNTPGGIIDLRDGQTYPHDPIHLCTKVTRYAPSDHGGELWNKFLDTVSCGNNKLCDFLQQVAGMAAVGRVYEENLIIANGSGANAKSTFFNVLGDALGTYSGTIAAAALTTSVGRVGAELANLKGKRIVIAAELEEGVRLSTSMLKQITSTDPIHAERKYKDPEDFIPSHTTILYTNHLPRVGSLDNGTWRRLLTVPFNASIPPEERIANYAEILASRAGGAIMKWIVEGAVKFCANGHQLKIPKIVADAIEQYRESNNWIRHFIEDCCEIGEGYTVGAADLYEQYGKWCEQTGEYHRHSKDFKEALENTGFEQRKPQNRKTWFGLRVIPMMTFPQSYG